MTCVFARPHHLPTSYDAVVRDRLAIWIDSNTVAGAAPGCRSKLSEVPASRLSHLQRDHLAVAGTIGKPEGEVKSSERLPSGLQSDPYA